VHHFYSLNLFDAPSFSLINWANRNISQLPIHNYVVSEPKGSPPPHSQEPITSRYPEPTKQFEQTKIQVIQFSKPRELQATLHP
jgi:hypothetical protein